MITAIPVTNFNEHMIEILQRVLRLYADALRKENELKGEDEE